MAGEENMFFDPCVWGRYSESGCADPDEIMFLPYELWMSSAYVSVKELVWFGLIFLEHNSYKAISGYIMSIRFSR